MVVHTTRRCVCRNVQFQYRTSHTISTQISNLQFDFPRSRPRRLYGAEISARVDRGHRSPGQSRSAVRIAYNHLTTITLKPVHSCRRKSRWMATNDNERDILHTRHGIHLDLSSRRSCRYIEVEFAATRLHRPFARTLGKGSSDSRFDVQLEGCSRW
jgi:hypothetical protein